MDIRTAKATTAERAEIRHHGLDLVDPDERFSAGRFAREARRWLAGVADRAKPALIVGGTGFFLRALTRPLFREPELPVDQRAALQAYLDQAPLERLRLWAASVEGTDELPGDRQRLIRLIEVATLTGRPLRWWHRHAAPEAAPLDLPIVVLETDRERLYDRIDRRVREMVAHGFLEEAARLRAAGFGPGDPGMNATGYPEMRAVLEGEITLDEAIARTQTATRAYARRQTTWFRHQLPAGAVRIANENHSHIVDRVVRLLEETA
jgi:tRNA dimethylallyltransferase